LVYFSNVTLKGLPENTETKIVIKTAVNSIMYSVKLRLKPMLILGKLARPLVPYYHEFCGALVKLSNQEEGNYEIIIIL